MTTIEEAQAALDAAQYASGGITAIELARRDYLCGRIDLDEFEARLEGDEAQRELAR